MRWTRYVTRRMTYRVRRNRAVLAPRRWRQVGDDASHHADDGGKRARSPGRPRISRKTIAQGRPVAPAEPVVLPRAFCCTRTMGASRHPAFPAPSHKFEGGSQAKLGRHAPRERGRTPYPPSPRKRGEGARDRLRDTKTVLVLPLPVLTGRGWGEASRSYEARKRTKPSRDGRWPCRPLEAKTRAVIWSCT